MPALASNFKNEVSTLIANKDFATLKTKLASWLPSDVAPILAALFRGCSKEFSAAGLRLTLILGVIGFLRIVIWSGFSHIYDPDPLLVATKVGVALVGIVLWGSPMGSMLPLIIKRVGFDPATSSAPFIATLVDVTGLIIYFSVAIVIMRGTLL